MEKQKVVIDELRHKLDLNLEGFDSLRYKIILKYEKIHVDWKSKMATVAHNKFVIGAYGNNVLEFFFFCETTQIN
jgi:hypothetical protein